LTSPEELGLSKGFNPALLKAVGEGVAALSEMVRDAVYHRVQRRFKIRREETRGSLKFSVKLWRACWPREQGLLKR